MRGKPGKTIPTGVGNDSARPVIDAERCTRCGMCIKACKSFTIISDPANGPGAPKVDIDNGLGCYACGQCMAVCARGAVRVTGRRLCPDDVMPMPPDDAVATPETLHNLMLTRRSVREFKKDLLTADQIAKILEMTSTAPMGIAPSDVSVTVISGHDKVQEFAHDMLGVFAKWRRMFNPVMLTLMRPFMGKAQVEAFRDFLIPAINEMEEAAAKGEDLLFYGAPCVLLFHTWEAADPADGQIACTYAMLAAQAMGLGTTMIGTVGPGLQREKALKRKWGIPEGSKMSLALIVGHPAFRYRNVIRRTLSSVNTVE